jgi:hypothetical protein
MMSHLSSYRHEEHSIPSETCIIASCYISGTLKVALVFYVHSPGMNTLYG